MPVTRLLALVMLLTSFAGLALAQSPQNNSSDLVVFQGMASLNLPIDPSHSRADLEPQIASGHSKTEYNSLLANARDEGEDSHRVSQGLSLGPEAERTCYLIRDYVVIRDSPHSDVTHRDGSFTCVPGSRFRVYTTTGQKVKVEQ